MTSLRGRCFKAVAVSGSSAVLFLCEQLWFLFRFTRQVEMMCLFCGFLWPGLQKLSPRKCKRSTGTLQKKARTSHQLLPVAPPPPCNQIPRHCAKPGPPALAQPCLSTGSPSDRRFPGFFWPRFLWPEGQCDVVVCQLSRERGAESCLRQLVLLITTICLALNPMLFVLM